MHILHSGNLFSRFWIIFNYHSEFFFRYTPYVLLLFGLEGFYHVPSPAGYFSAFCLVCSVWGLLSAGWRVISSVQLLNCVRLFATPWIAARQASLSITNSRSSPRLTSIESVMPSSHLILCRPLLLLPPIPPSIRVFSNESILHMRWLKYWSFSFSIIPSKEIPGLISFRMDWRAIVPLNCGVCSCGWGWTSGLWKFPGAGNLCLCPGGWSWISSLWSAVQCPVVSLGVSSGLAWLWEACLLMFLCSCFAGGLAWGDLHWSLFALGWSLVSG